MAGLAGCDGDGGSDAGMTGMDAGPAADAGSVSDSGGGTDAGSMDQDAGETMTDAGGPSCGTERPSIADISGTEGLVIARDGTIYYSQSAAVGRMLPGGSPENSWTSVGGSGTVWGLALNAANDRLYVGVPGLGVRVIDLTAATPMATTVVTGGSPNGLTIGPDDALYYSDFNGGHVHRLTAGGSPSQVTTSPIASPNGVVFLPDGTLLVAQYAMPGALLRLTLSGGVETAREQFAAVPGAPDGLALDADGNVYVGSQTSMGGLLMFSPDGSSMMRIQMGIPFIANIEFGAGPLTCTDLYITSSGVLQRYEAGTIAGAAVPWH
ncbi:MAG: SMP-30/gluconolactonase/LRE family protein [Sandaracinaceae bacterium]